MVSLSLRASSSRFSTTAPDAFAKHGAGGRSVKGSTMAIDTEDAALLEALTALLRSADVHPPARATST